MCPRRIRRGQPGRRGGAGVDERSGAGVVGAVSGPGRWLAVSWSPSTTTEVPGGSFIGGGSLSGWLSGCGGDGLGRPRGEMPAAAVLARVLPTDRPAGCPAVQRGLCAQMPGRLESQLGVLAFPQAFLPGHRADGPVPPAPAPSGGVPSALHSPLDFLPLDFLDTRESGMLLRCAAGTVFVVQECFYRRTPTECGARGAIGCVASR